MVILAANPRFVKISAEKKAQIAEMKAALRPGLVVEYTTSDYHEDESTPVGFHSIGDRLELLRVVERRPIIRYETRETVDEYDVWLVRGRWGEHTKDEPYLAWMTRPVATQPGPHEAVEGSDEGMTKVEEPKR
jgi:hypothetical protein